MKKLQLKCRYSLHSTHLNVTLTDHGCVNFRLNSEHGTGPDRVNHLFLVRKFKNALRPLLSVEAGRIDNAKLGRSMHTTTTR